MATKNSALSTYPTLSELEQPLEQRLAAFEARARAALVAGALEARTGLGSVAVARPLILTRGTTAKPHHLEPGTGAELVEAPAAGNEDDHARASSPRAEEGSERTMSMINSASPSRAIRHEGTRLVLGVMTPAQARAELARRADPRAGNGSPNRPMATTSARTTVERARGLLAALNEKGGVAKQLEVAEKAGLTFDEIVEALKVIADDPKQEDQIREKARRMLKSVAEGEALNARCGLPRRASAIRHEGTRLVLGVMTPAEARAELARREGRSR